MATSSRAKGAAPRAIAFSRRSRVRKHAMAARWCLNVQIAMESAPRDSPSRACARGFDVLGENAIALALHPPTVAAAVQRAILRETTELLSSEGRGFRVVGVRVPSDVRALRA